MVMTTTERRERDTATVPFAATVATMAVVGVVVVGQMYVTIPMMPQLGAAWHTSLAGTTWATSAFAVAYALGSLASGRLSARYGLRAVMVVSILAMAVATLLVPLGASLASGGALRALQGLLAGAFVPMAYAHLSARIPSRRLPLALTTVSCAMGGTVVFGQVESQLLVAAFGWQSVFLITAPLLVLGAALVWKVVGPPPVGDVAGSAGPDRPRGVRTSHGPLVPLYLVTLAVAGSLTAIYTGVQLYGPAELVASDNAMLALRTSALPGLLASVLLASVLGAIVAHRRVTGGFVVAAVGMLGVALFADNVFGLGAALLLFVLGISAVGPALVQAVGNAAGGGQLTAIAKYGFMLNLGGGVGALLPSLVSDLANLALLIAIIIGIAITVMVCSRAGHRATSRYSAAK
jgi:predicted MFS family arabinose efflux permease